MALRKAPDERFDSDESGPRAASFFRGLANADSVVAAVCLMGIGSMYVISCAEWTLLLFLNHVGFTTPDDTSFYIFTFAMALVVPLVGNIFCGLLASRIGEGLTLSWGCLFVAVGMALLILSRTSKLLFLIAFCMYACCTSYRIIRISIISQVVCPEDRTAVLAIHQLMAPVGALLGPLAWLLLQTWQGAFTVLHRVFTVDRFALNYGIGSLVMLGMSKLAFLKLLDLGNKDASGATPSASDCEDLIRPRSRILEAKADYEAIQVSESGQVLRSEANPNNVTIQLADGRRKEIDLNQYQRTRFLFFSAIMLGVSLTMGIFRVAFQPILINTFGANDAEVAKVFTMVATAALFPPLMVAAMSRVIQDHQILCFGLVLKLIGVALYLPIFGTPVREWQVILGFVLIVKASTFYTTAAVSLFTKVLGKMSSSALLGYLWSIANIGPAVAQLWLSTTIVEYFGGWRFAAFAMPAALSVLLTISPLGRRLLDPQNEVTRLVLMSADTNKR